MICQRASELGIRALLFLALRPEGKLSPAHEIAEHVGTTESYMAKILQRLTHAGIVESFRGPGKGVRLAPTSVSLTLESLRMAIEGRKAEDACVLGLDECSETNPCALHYEWLPIRNSIHDLLSNTTVGQLLESLSRECQEPPRRSRGKRDMPNNLEARRSKA